MASTNKRKLVDAPYFPPAKSQRRADEKDEMSPRALFAEVFPSHAAFCDLVVQSIIGEYFHLNLAALARGEYDAKVDVAESTIIPADKKWNRKPTRYELTYVRPEKIWTTRSKPLTVDARVYALWLRAHTVIIKIYEDLYIPPLVDTTCIALPVDSRPFEMMHCQPHHIYESPLYQLGGAYLYSNEVPTHECKRVRAMVRCGWYLASDMQSADKDTVLLLHREDGGPAIWGLLDSRETPGYICADNVVRVLDKCDECGKCGKWSGEAIAEDGSGGPKNLFCSCDVKWVRVGELDQNKIQLQDLYDHELPYLQATLTILNKYNTCLLRKVQLRSREEFERDQSPASLAGYYKVDKFCWRESDIVLKELQNEWNQSSGRRSEVWCFLGRLHRGALSTSSHNTTVDSSTGVQDIQHSVIRRHQDRNSHSLAYTNSSRFYIDEGNVPAFFRNPYTKREWYEHGMFALSLPY